MNNPSTDGTALGVKTSPSAQPVLAPRRADGEVILELRGIQKTFERNNAPPLRVLSDVNLSIRRKEFVCMIGPSGSGKSTIMRIAAGLIEPSKGRSSTTASTMRVSWTACPSCSRASPSTPG